MQQIYQRMVVKATFMLISALKEAAKGVKNREALAEGVTTTMSMENLLADFQRNFRSRIVMLFVSTILLSCDKSFLNGDIFNKIIHIKDAEAWERYKTYLTDHCFALRHNMNPQILKEKTEKYLDAAAGEWPTLSARIKDFKKYFAEKFDSTAVLSQATNQLAKLFWILHRCPSKLAHLFRYVLADPQVRRRLQKHNPKLDKSHLRRIEAEESENLYVLRKVYSIFKP